MKIKLKFLIIFFFFTSHKFTVLGNDKFIDPEPYFSKTDNIRKSLKTEKFLVVTANDYATKIGYKILEQGGTVFDAAVAIQLVLGLVEPQSSGLGGGTFITFFENNSNKILSYEGRETAPKNIPENIFLDQNNKPKKFFSAAVGGLSVGVPGTLKVFYELHKDYGTLKWKNVLAPVINLSKEGFFPPKRLLSALKKEKFFFNLYPKSNFKKIISDPDKKFKNASYTKTLEKISEDFTDFYSGEIANNIVKTVKNSKNSGYLSLDDLKNYEIKKKKAFCRKLANNYTICGPNLPSSGTICILQALKLYEYFIKKNQNILKNTQKDLQLKLSILNLIYLLRDNYLGDVDFENFNFDELLDINFLLKYYKNFKLILNETQSHNNDQIFNSTSHFTLIDKFNNVLTATSSIESGFGSRLFTNGFFLNNQLTDFSFKKTNYKQETHKNRPLGNKRPLSSMAPIIVFDNNDEFFLTIGSPGGKAIISYIFKVLTDILYKNVNLQESIESPNFIKINDKLFFENKELNRLSLENGKVRKLTSGLAVIKKERTHLIGVADSRRDGSVRGK